MTRSIGNKVNNADMTRSIGNKVRSIGNKITKALGIFKATEVSGEAKERSPAKLFNRNADKAKSKFSVRRLFGLTRIAGNEASREGAPHRMTFTRGLAYKNPPTFHCIACSLRKQSKDSSFYTSLKLKQHCIEKAGHEKDNNSRPVHHADCFCEHCGNGFKNEDEKDAHVAVCDKAP